MRALVLLGLLALGACSPLHVAGIVSGLVIEGVQEAERGKGK